MQKISTIILIVLYILLLIISTYFCGISLMYPKKYDDTISQVCSEFNIPKHTMYALVNTESRFNPNAVSSSGAVGLTQILPSTAEYICVKNNLNFSNFNLFDPEDNLYLGAMYLNYLFNK